MDLYDIAVLGCGPAGLSAAINATIRNKKVIVLGNNICSPPLHKAQKIDNYLGFYEIQGEDLLNKFVEHATKMGIEITPKKSDMIYELDGVYNILSGEEVIMAKTIIIATGIPYKPTLPKEDYYLGKGLGYCATCDGPIYKDKDVLLISHSEEAESEANFMAEICRKVYYLPLYKMKNTIDERVEILEGKPDYIVGNDHVEGLVLKDGTQINIEGLFILAGETAPDRLIPGLEIENKHIKVNRKQETNLKGVYAAGDCTGAPYQVAKSVGEGQVAGLNASIYVSKIR
ncbi:MAG: NAD(P)/FAD-dependent oxidoreductase [Syntrophomonadaceae bacterium]|nr:NAD(P)/FAD-dependent oxidoreductase [Syntrophomonadaceae bacterium]